ncbi:S8 family serine peptidase [Actinosynnema sp. NPDC050436]|uniref:S8 family serine peptidase n=1 Tax=Actinosynnema sp. NPDC050436 TaxID=3155659 RepID=UPI0033FB547E
MSRKSLALLTTALVVAAGSAALSAPLAVAAPGGKGAVIEVKLAAGVGVAAVRDVLGDREVAAVRPLFSRLDERLAALRPVGAKSSAPGLERWHRVQLAPGVDARAAARELAARDDVEAAHPQPEGSDPTTPNFTGQQGYSDAVGSSGIDADYAHTVTGGKGGNVKVVDLERNWNPQHEDLAKLRLPGALIANGTPDFVPSSIDHGTAVAGVIGADANTFGVTGLVPDAGLHYTNVVNYENGYDLANAILTAGAGVGVGDVLLIEQHVYYCNDYAPMEVWDSVYDAIVTVVQSGRHVVEAGGNGNQNLNDPCFGARFPADKPDSGAIIVGAGAAPGCTGTPRSKLGFSNYGTRVDLQGWGECVATTGYGDLHGTGANDKYTAYFSGTSSASPVVASALASLLSVAEANGETLSPAEAREILIATGTAQSGTQHIGPLPNLYTAVGNYLANVNFPERVAYPGPRTATRWVPTSLAVQAWDGDDDPLTFWATGLPPGLSLATGTGVISGTPTTAGTYTTTVYASDSYTGPAQTTFTWTVS